MSETVQQLKIIAAVPAIGWELTSWSESDGPSIYEHLERFNWAPWLAASADTLSGRAKIFPQGQLVLKNEVGIPLASLSTNQIAWNGDPITLPNWDNIAGDPTTYENTYIPDGNTLVLMSMNVHPEYQGKGLARIMIEEIQKVARNLGIIYLIGSFRPNHFGKFKSQPGMWNTDFGTYCQTTREDGLPIDGWLRSLVRNGMKPLIVDKKGMMVSASLEDFLIFKQAYNIDMWMEVEENVWECGEVGRWTLHPKENLANYQESNLFGALPMLE